MRLHDFTVFVLRILLFRLLITDNERHHSISGIAKKAGFCLHRRHLDTRQRAMVAARIKHLFEAEARARMLEGRNQYSPSANLREADTGKASDKAAEALNVSPRAVEHASRVLERSEGLKERKEIYEAHTLGLFCGGTGAAFILWRSTTR